MDTITISLQELQAIHSKLDNLEISMLASKTVLTFDEAALLTGFSKSYLYKLTSAGIIPHSKPLGKHLFFDRAQVQAWLLGKPIKTLAEIKMDAGNYVTLKKSAK